MCQMCAMNTVEDIVHFLFICPYLDGARFYALLLWKNQISSTTYNLFFSALQSWQFCKLVPLFIDPMSQFLSSDIAPHDDLKINIYKFAQDYAYSIHRQRQIFYGDKPTAETFNWRRI